MLDKNRKICAPFNFSSLLGGEADTHTSEPDLLNYLLELSRQELEVIGNSKGKRINFTQ